MIANSTTELIMNYSIPTPEKLCKIIWKTGPYPKQHGNV